MYDTHLHFRTNISLNDIQNKCWLDSDFFTLFHYTYRTACFSKWIEFEESLLDQINELEAVGRAFIKQITFD